jgi:hypothetical protein
MEPAFAQWVVDHAVGGLEGMRQMPSSTPMEALPDIQVGLQEDDKQMQGLVQLLTDESNHSLVLLHGMGGIGKTTLAKAVFNQLKAGNRTLPCCFVRLDPDMKVDDVVKQQQQLLQELARYKGDTTRRADKGQQLLAEQLGGKTVLLVVDNVWGNQLEWVVSKRTLKELLDNGSMVLVTSRELTAADRFLGEGALDVKKVPMQFLSAERSLELFCRHAFGSSPPPAELLQQVKAVVARCGGLPMALEVLGLLFRESSDWAKSCKSLNATLEDAYTHKEAHRLEAERTLFGALRLSWSMLKSEEQEALLDIVWFLKAQRWDLLQAACGAAVMRRLCRLGLVGHNTKWQLAIIHDTVTSFCSSASAIGREPLRKVLHSDYITYRTQVGETACFRPLAIYQTYST